MSLCLRLLHELVHVLEVDEGIRESEITAKLTDLSQFQ
jgi:hypothetical protein